MRYFLVDTENVSDYSFIKEMEVTSEDTIVIFMSEKAGRMSLEDLRALYESKANVLYEDIYTGEANALDFQLIAFLSLRIATADKEYEYFVVSNDKGYVLPVKYLSDKTGKKISILKTNNSTGVDSESSVDEQKLVENLNAVCNRLNLAEDVKDIVIESRALNVLHNKLRERLGYEEGAEMYKTIKPYVKSLYKAS